MSLLLSIALLAAPVLQAETYDNSVFEFTLPVPEGLVLLSPAEIAAADGVSVEERELRPREDFEPGEIFSHHLVWVDTTPARRQIKLLLQENSPPFLRPEVFVEAMTNELDMTVDADDSLSGDLAPCMYLEGTRTDAKGTVQRTLVAYLPGQTRYALLFFSAPAADWMTRRPEYLDALTSVTFNRPIDPEAQQRMAQQAAAQAAGAARPRAEKESWDSLEVTGSLALAALLVMGLFLGGGRSTP